MKDVTFIDVSGFSTSGSSAAVDLLKEFRGTYEAEAEIRIIKDPYGLCELERALVDNWELINSTAAISDFIAINKIYSRTNKYPWSPAGLNYKKTITPRYMDIISDFIGKLTDFEMTQDYYYNKFKKSYFRYVTDRVRQGIQIYSKGRLHTSREYKGYFAHPDRDTFCKAVQELFIDLFRDKIEENNCPFVILDQAVSPQNTQVIHRYFKKAKMIIVDRDPRDMYINDLKWGASFNDYFRSAESGRRFAQLHKQQRKNIIIDEDVLYIRFEDIVLNYEDTVSKICEFVGFDKKDHIYPKMYLKPEVSCKNVGLWKGYYDTCKEPINEISRILPEMLYEG